MICPKCNQKALMLFADGNCRACQPVKSEKPRTDYSQTVKPRMCKHCGGLIPCKPFWRPSEYRRRVHCSDECFRAAQGERASKEERRPSGAFKKSNCNHGGNRVGARSTNQEEQT